MSEIVRNSLKKAVKGTTLVFIGTVLSMGLWFLSRILVVRNTTVSGLGIYSLCVAIVSILSLFAVMGLTGGVSRFVSIALGRGDPARADNAARTCIQLGTLSGLLVPMVLFLTSGFLADHVFYLPALKVPLRIMSCSIYFFVIQEILVYTFIAHGDVRPKVFFRDIGQPLFFLLLAAWVYKFNPSLVNVVWAYLLACVLSFIAVAVVGHRQFRLTPLSLRGSGGMRRKIFDYSFPLLGVAIMGMVFKWTDSLMIGRYMSADDLGVYSVAVSLVGLLTLAFQSSGFVFLPIAGDLYAREAMKDMGRIYQVLTKWVFAATLPLFFVLFFFPQMSITFLFGGRFTDAAVPLMLLCVGQMINIFFGLNVMLMIVMKMQRILMLTSLISALINILLNYVLIKWAGLGLSGAAWATVGSFLVMNIANSIVLYQRTGFHPLSWIYIRPVSMSGVIGLLIYLLAKSLPLYIWMVPVYFLLFIAGYSLAILLSRSIEQEDMDLLRTVMAKVGVSAPGLMAKLERFVPQKPTSQ